MHGSLNDDIEAWEGEGGAASATLSVPTASMSGGTASQMEWAERFKQPVPADQGGDDC